MKKVHRPEFKFEGWTPKAETIVLSLQLQYEVDVETHRQIVADVHWVYMMHGATLRNPRDWNDEAVRAMIAKFVRQRIAKRNSVVDKMYDNGNLSVTIELADAPLPGIGSAAVIKEEKEA